MGNTVEIVSKIEVGFFIWVLYIKWSRISTILSKSSTILSPGKGRPLPCPNVMDFFIIIGIIRLKKHILGLRDFSKFSIDNGKKIVYDIGAVKNRRMRH